MNIHKDISSQNLQLWLYHCPKKTLEDQKGYVCLSKKKYVYLTINDEQSENW
jgi:hypothetical protein